MIQVTKEEGKAVERIILGKTGLEVNRLGFGGIPIQRVDENQAVETVLHAVERGVNFIDTSRLYTTSERRIGKALQQTDKRVILASKSQSRTSKGLRADLETSLKELQMSSIDLCQCHFVKDDHAYNQVISSGGALEGLIGHIGLTGHSLDLLDRILDDGLFETIMVCSSFLEPLAQEKIIPHLDHRVRWRGNYQVYAIVVDPRKIPGVGDLEAMVRLHFYVDPLLPYPIAVTLKRTRVGASPADCNHRRPRTPPLTENPGLTTVESIVEVKHDRFLLFWQYHGGRQALQLGCNHLSGAS